MGEFAEPYSARIIARLLGSPEDEWRTIADWSATMGLALGVTFRRDLPRIEAALDGLLGYADAVIASARARAARRTSRRASSATGTRGG